MNDIYIFHIYILIIHYIIELYISGCGSRAAFESSRACLPSSWNGRAELSRAELGQPPSCTEPSRAELGSARFQP
jgi:hypothetical protein